MSLRRAAPLLVAAALLGLLAVVAPEVYRATFSDLATFLRVAALVAALAIWVYAARRFVPDPRAGLAVAAVPVAVALWIVLWPYLRPATEVDEAFPPVSAATLAPTTTAAATTTVPATTASPTTEPPSAAGEPVDVTTPATAAPTSTTTTTTPTTTTTSTTTTTVPPEPVELGRGGFQGLTGHRGSGDAALYRLGDDSILLRFEEVDIGSGPALDVYLVPGSDQRGLGGGHHVAALTAERGNQNYTPPATVNLSSGTWTVLVWCETFDVEVANATISL